jgi:HKD family nuclease
MKIKMKAEFLSAHAVRRRLARYIEDYSEFHWAVAWGTYGTLAKRLFARRGKFRNVTFGVAFSQTDPEIVDALVDVANGYVATRFAGGTFHPKVYGFRSGKHAVAIIGSANFTRGGLGNNLEAAVALTGSVEDSALANILAFAKSSAGYGHKVTAPYAAAYRATCARAAAFPKPPREPLSEARIRGAAARHLTMDWAEYASQVWSSRRHDPAKSLQLIAIARRWFAEDRSFAQFSPPQRKALAGVLGEYQKDGPDLDREWGWLGSMRGMGDFANRIEENDPSLARALDGIPRSGQVTRAQYDRYCALFRQAFAQSGRTGGVPTATRLLAMKRPDTFLCVCKPNIAAASDALGFARTTLNLSNYWERVVEPIRLSTWYNAEKPEGRDGELWEARAAMLDALFYRP